MFLELSEIAQFIVSGNFIWTWCLIILTYASFWSYTLYSKSRSIKNQIASSLEALDNFEDSVDYDKTVKTITNKINKNPLFAQSWEQYIATCKEAKHDTKPSDSRTLSSPHRPSTFFNEENIISSQIDDQLYGSISGQLSGLGILGTFVGLSAGIFLAKDGLSGNNMVQLQSALSELLGGAALAFWTSIIGILTSLVFSQFESRSMSKLKTKLSAFNNKLNQFIQLATAEETSQKHLSIQTNTMGLMLDELKIMNKQKNTMHQKILKNMLSEFTAELTKGSNEHINSTSQTFKAASDAVQSATINIQKSSQQLNNTTEKISHNLEKNLNGFTEKLSSEMLASISEFKKSAKEASSHMGLGILEAGIFAAEQLKVPSKEIAEAVTDLTSNTRKATEDWTDAMLFTEKVANILEQTQSQLVGITKAITEVEDDIHNDFVVSDTIENTRKSIL